MFAALKALPLLWRLITVVSVLAALLGAVGGLYAYVKHQGYVEGYSDASAKCEAEKRAMEDANKKAIDKAAEKLAEAERELMEKEATLDDYIMLLDREADQADGAGDICLFAPSVRRLSAVQ
jgi:uncharacterized membrane protein